MRGSEQQKTERARALRRTPTDVERKLWHRLSNRQIADAKFVRQEPIGPYFADFACREQRLIVELDGSQHGDSMQDKRRDTFLGERGYRVLRFWNNEVNDNLEGVLETIRLALTQRDGQSSSPRSRGEDESTEGRPGEGASRNEPHPAPPPHPAPSRLDLSPRAGQGELRIDLSGLRGSLEANAPLAPLSWFRTGGAAEQLFTPANEQDLALFLAQLPGDVPLLVVGLGSNLLVRDGGVPGVVIRLGKGFAHIAVEPSLRLRAGAGAPDVKVARAAAEAGIVGLSFLRGIPGAIGGALRMNGGAYGGETGDVLVEARAIDRQGRPHVLSLAEMGYSYRHCGAPEDLIFTEALFQGREGDAPAILAEMNAITEARSATQPVNTRTGGSTFKNPPGEKAWQLIDAAGCRGLRIGDAQVSELHCNFLINHGQASAAEIEGLGEEVRRRVREHSGVELEWEIKRVGVAQFSLRTEAAL